LLLAVSFATPSHVYAESAEGFTYTVSDSNATVTGCVGSCPAALEIPAVLGGITVTTIGASAFYGAGLTSLVIPDSVTAIGFRSFAGNSLNAVTLGASLATIGDYAFFLNALTSIRIPTTVTAIGSQAFRYNSLTNVTFAGNAPTAGSLVLADNSALTRVFRSVSASGWVATWGGMQVVFSEQPETWIARGATSNDDVNGETAGTSCSNPDYIAGPTAADVQIQLGINLTLPGGIVHLCPGTYDVDEEIRLDGIDITLQGAGASKTILDGGNTFVGGVSQNTGNTIITTFNAITVNGIGFQNGYTAEGGGAINAGTAIINDSTFSNNTAGFGGAIWCFDGSTITNSTFTSNTAGYGGAIWCYGATSISNGIFTDNSAALNGGAIQGSSGMITVGQSSFTRNRAGHAAGAIGGPIATITSSTFRSNRSTLFEGGAMSVGDLVLSSSRFIGNQAGDDGGAISARTAKVTRSRFLGNTAVAHGGALYIFAIELTELRQIWRNTFMRNRAGGGGGAITLGPCTVPSRSQARRVEQSNRFSGNRATEQRRTRNVERWLVGCD
jgi:predicted outer membrane repeat protein